MASVILPNLLRDLARAGQDGLPLLLEPSFFREIEMCREWGFDIDCRDGRAYLIFNQDSLVPEWVERETPLISWKKLSVSGFMEIGSTNEETLVRARRGAAAGTLIYSETQSAGRGRKGRAWISPPGSGLYFSLLLRPKQSREVWPLLTYVASVGLYETIVDLARETDTCVDLDLKWPNDILLSRRKCAGILLETCDNKPDSGAAVVGVGINVRRAGLPEALSRLAISLDEAFGKILARRKVLVMYLHHFQILYELFEAGQQRQIIERWKKCSSMWDGAQVVIQDGERQTAAVTCGITESGALKIRLDDGIEKTILAGDVTVRSA
jgi:BirA family biotin operon repressor/biotin-[acetyl-CoA-carboxylase] ligase